MLLRRAPLLLLWGMLASLVPGGRCGSPRHSLRYSYLRVSESSWEMPQFFSVILLDDQPIARYDNRTNRMEPLVPWMGAEEAKIQGLERVFRTDLEWLSNLNHQTAGLHTWKAILGCELREDGSKGGFLKYSYDGMNFISFNKETVRWVAAQPQAQKVKEKWGKEPWRSQRNKVYLEEMCIERMQKYLPNQKEALKKTGGLWWISFGFMPMIMLGHLILFLAYRHRRRLKRKLCHGVENFPLPQINRSPSTDGTEDETQS